MGPTVLFTHLKIILLQYFSIFSFQMYLNGPLVMGRQIGKMLNLPIKYNKSVMQQKSYFFAVELLSVQPSLVVVVVVCYSKYIILLCYL